MPLRSSWPLLRDHEAQEQRQEQNQEQPQPQHKPDRPLPQPSRASSKEMEAVLAPMKLPSESKTRARSHDDHQSQEWPLRILWAPLVLRNTALLAGVCALAIAIWVTVGPMDRVWPVVFVFSISTTILNTFEIFSLASSRLPAFIFKIPRLHPIALIIADLLLVSLSIWNFLVLFIEGRNTIFGDTGGEKAYNAETENAVEICISIGIGFIHVLLFVFDCIDCCSARSPNSRVNELKYRKKRRGTSGVGDDIFEMDWG